MAGTFIAAAIGRTGEVHNQEFTGTLPPNDPIAPAPEPASLALLGTGITMLAGLSAGAPGANASCLSVGQFETQGLASEARVCRTSV